MTETTHFPIFYTVKRLTYRVFLVTKETEEDRQDYFVRYDEKGWKCSCIANSMFGRECRHIKMVKAYIETGHTKYYVNKHLNICKIE